MMTLLMSLMLAAPPTPAEEIALELGVPALASFDDKLIKIYRSDDVTVEMVLKSPEKYPLRMAVLTAAKSMSESYKLKLKLELYEPKLDVAKKDITEIQEDIATAILILKESNDVLNKIENRKSDPSQRWQAHLDYLLAVTRLRIAYLEELNLAYGLVHRNELPKLDEKKMETGWTVTPAAKMHSKSDIRKLDEEARADLESLKTKYPGSPWAKLAERDLATASGLNWVGAAVKPPLPPKVETKKKKP